MSYWWVACFCAVTIILQLIEFKLLKGYIVSFAIEIGLLVASYFMGAEIVQYLIFAAVSLLSMAVIAKTGGK